MHRARPIVPLLGLMLLATQLGVGAGADAPPTATVIHASDEMGWASAVIDLQPGAARIQVIATSTSPSATANLHVFDAAGRLIAAASTGRAEMPTRVYAHAGDHRVQATEPGSETVGPWPLPAYVDLSADHVGSGLRLKVLGYGLALDNVTWRLEVLAATPPIVGATLSDDGGIYRTTSDFEEGHAAGISAWMGLANVAIGARTTFEVEHGFFGDIAFAFPRHPAMETTLTRGDTVETCPCSFDGGPPGTYVVTRTGVEAPAEFYGATVQGVDARLPA